MDWTVTMLAIAGVPAPPDHAFDGVSMFENLRGLQPWHKRPMFWRMKHRHQRAAREDDWQKLRMDEHEHLFNVRQDARER
ncbi:MAG: twin-arginine translocation pathway signal protein, partial [Rubrivivax sp.]